MGKDFSGSNRPQGWPLDCGRGKDRRRRRRRIPNPTITIIPALAGSGTLEIVGKGNPLAAAKASSAATSPPRPPTADALVEIRRQVGEVGGVDQAVVVEVALVPAGDRLVEVRSQQREVGGVDDAVQIGIAQQRVFDFDLARGEMGGLPASAESAYPMPYDRPLVLVWAAVEMMPVPFQ